MAVMIYGMVSMDSASACPADGLDVTTAGMVAVMTAAESNDNCRSHSVMLLPGLSLVNLLLFLLCTPCQVHASACCCLFVCQDICCRNLTSGLFVSA